MKRKFRLKEVLPDLIRKYKTLSPVELKKMVLQDFNKDITDKAILMFFKRHPEIKANMLAEISLEVQSQVEVSGDIFKNGNFEELPTIKKWKIEKATLVSPKFMQQHIGAVKRICRGIYFLKDKNTKQLTKVQIPNWQPKSPERLTLEQFQEYISYVHKAGNCTNIYRIAFRDFWLSREGKTLKPSEVSGLMSSGVKHVLGRWKNVRVSHETIYKILEYVKERDFQCFAADFTGYKAGSRHEAVFTQFLQSKVYVDEGNPTIDVTDKGFHRKGRQTFPKLLTPDLYAVLQECWKRYGNNPFAGLDSTKLSNLNKEAYRIFLKDDVESDGAVKEFSALELGLASPFHFWRHMFGRAMLDATNYNYTATAFLGGWKNESMLKEVYGAPSMTIIRKAGLQFIPQI